MKLVYTVQWNWSTQSNEIDLHRAMKLVYTEQWNWSTQSNEIGLHRAIKRSKASTGWPLKEKDTKSKQQTSLLMNTTGALIVSIDWAMKLLALTMLWADLADDKLVIFLFFLENRSWHFMQIVSFYEIVCCVYSLELPHWGNSNEYTQHTIIVLKIEKIDCWLCWCLTTCQPLWVIFCCLSEKGRRDSRGDKREEQGRKRNRNKREETEEIKTFSTLTCYKDSKPISVGRPGDIWRSKRYPLVIAICFLTWHPTLPSVAQTTHISNKFSCSHRCLSHWSSTVVLHDHLTLNSDAAQNYKEPAHKKPTIRPVCPPKTQISLYIHLVWQGFSFIYLWITWRL